MMRYEAIVVGASAGGMEALRAILPRLPADFGAPVIVVQHQSATSDGLLASCLNDKCRLNVKQAEEKEAIVPGTIYIAPPNYHLLIEEDRIFSLSIDEAVNYARPSIDVLFETAAEVYQTSLAGVILTGSNSDGTRGLKTIKELGGLTIVQEPDTAEVDVMPRAALAATEVNHI